MVRVNHPPGGQETRLEANPKRDPITVRILKPPGGGSSISFDEPDDFHSRATKPVTPAKQTPEDVPSPSSAAKLVPNGSSNVEGLADSPQPVVSPNKEENGTINGNHTIQTTNGTSSPSMHNGSHNSVSDIVVQSKVSSSDNLATEVKPVSTPITSPDLNAKPVEKFSTETVSISTSDSVNSKVATCGTVTSNIKLVNTDIPTTPPMPKLATSATTTPVASDDAWPTPEGASGKTPDTGSRLFGNERATPNVSNSTPSRQVKDRMKSSIFTYEEESTPPPKSVSSPVSVTDSKTVHEQPAAPPRQRIPPGGFSTKLW